MSRILMIALALSLAANAARAAVAGDAPRPEAAERVAALDRLFASLAAAPDEAAGRAIADEIWRRWATGPTAPATRRLAEAMRRIQGYDFAGAIDILDRLIAAHPGWAEPWNQRAFARFLRDEPDLALEDIARVLDLEPRHFGALSGKAIILLRMGRGQLGQKALRRAVAVNPWLRERDMLTPDPGRDI